MPYLSMTSVKDVLRFFAEMRFVPDGKSRGIDTISYAKNIQCLPTQFLYVYDYTSDRIVYSKGTQRCIGYLPEEMTLRLITEYIHPEDKQMVLDVMQASIYEAIKRPFSPKPFEWLATFDYRIRKKNGDYIRIMRQTSITEVDRPGRMTRTLSLCTDISRLKLSNEASYQFKGPKSQELDRVIRVKWRRKRSLSVRESEIHQLILEGKSEKEISEILFISLSTVKNHKQSIFKKLGVNNAIQLIVRSNN